LSNRRILVKVDLRRGHPATIRGSVPELGSVMELHPSVFVEEATERFRKLASIRNRGRNVDPSCPHVDPKRDMYLAVTVAI